MTSRALLVVLVWTALALAPSQAQTSGGFDKSDYLPGTLQGIIDQHGGAFEKPAPLKPAPRAFLFSSTTFSSRVRLLYTGQARPISALRKEAITGYFKSKSTPQFADLYETEMLFGEGEKDWWIPVQTGLIPSFREELRGGERPLVFLVWMGGVSEWENPDWIFLVTDFEAD